jgi:hypothetical protein
LYLSLNKQEEKQAPKDEKITPKTVAEKWPKIAKKVEPSPSNASTSEQKKLPVPVLVKPKPSRDVYDFEEGGTSPTKTSTSSLPVVPGSAFRGMHPFQLPRAPLGMSPAPASPFVITYQPAGGLVPVHPSFGVSAWPGMTFGPAGAFVPHQRDAIGMTPIQSK